jgi:hypothetical protein
MFQFSSKNSTIIDSLMLQMAAAFEVILFQLCNLINIANINQRKELVLQTEVGEMG